MLSGTATVFLRKIKNIFKKFSQTRKITDDLSWEESLTVVNWGVTIILFITIIRNTIEIQITDAFLNLLMKTKCDWVIRWVYKTPTTLDFEIPLKNHSW